MPSPLSSVLPLRAAVPAGLQCKGPSAGAHPPLETKDNVKEDGNHGNALTFTSPLLCEHRFPVCTRRLGGRGCSTHAEYIGRDYIPGFFITQGVCDGCSAKISLKNKSYTKTTKRPHTVSTKGQRRSKQKPKKVSTKSETKTTQRPNKGRNKGQKKI